MSLDLDKSTWKRVAFGDVIKNVTVRVDDPSAAGVDRYVGLEHLDPGVMTVQRWDSPDKVEAQKLRFQPGDVIFGRRRAYQKKVARADFEGICSAHALVLRARPDAMVPDFLPVFLASDYFLDRAISISVGSLSPTVNWRDLKVQEFDLPPLDEQKRLVDLLWAVERERRAANQLERILSRALAVQADAFLREVEESSGLTLLADLLRESMTDGIREKGPDIEGGVPYIRVSDMTAPRLDVNGMLRTSAALAAANRSSEVRSGDLVIALRSKIGLCHVITAELDGCNIAQGVGKIAPDRARTTVEYLYEVLMAPRTQSALDRIAKGTTIREVGLKALRSFRIPIPESLAEQHVIVEKLARIRSARAAAYEEASATASLADGLSREVFGGAS